MLSPSAPNSGITLINTNFPDNPLIVGTFVPEPAMHATVIKGQSFAVSTIEHLLATIAGLEIDNVKIEIDGPEVPIFDGSALPFVQAIESVGLETQESKKRFLTPKRTLKFEDEDRFLEIIPDYDHSHMLTFDYSLDFAHPLMQESQFRCNITAEFFTKEIAPARTFGFLQQLPFLRKHGLAKGTTLGNTVVVGDNTFLNSTRFSNEFIRHKLLDLIGDLSLLGKNLVGSIKAHKTGHNFNRKVIEHFLNNRDQWEEF
jgi:UDP-3-O-[3-hydroxymyristoyl] N-acetylglucosamine deacetylase